MWLIIFVWEQKLAVLSLHFLVIGEMQKNVNPWINIYTRTNADKDQVLQFSWHVLFKWQRKKRSGFILLALYIQIQ